MTNRAKQKGTSYETSLVPLLAQYYPGTERRTLSGSNDRGDFNTPSCPITFEAKHRQQMSLGAWVDEAVKEAGNAETPYGAVIHKRKGKGDPREQFITMRLGDFLDLIQGL